MNSVENLIQELEHSLHHWQSSGSTAAVVACDVLEETIKKLKEIDK